MANNTMSAQQQQMQMLAANMQARKLIIENAIDSTIPIAGATVTGGAGTIINVPIRNVGLLKRLWIEISATYTNGTGGVLTLSPFGASNIISNVNFTDLSSQQRINTTGWHLVTVASAKAQKPYGSAATTDSPCGYGNIFQKIWQAPSTIAVSTPGTLNAIYEIPISYSDYDLSGAIYMSVVNATANLQFTLNPNFAVGSASDQTNAVYQSAGTTNLGTLTSVTYTVYQNYLDQLPHGSNGQIILPYYDMSKSYLLNSTVYSGIVQGQDNPFPFANFRNILSTTAVYDNNGVLNTGSDINYWAIQAANYTNVFKYDPYFAAFLSRLILQDDFPKGMYYFDSRKKPINTVQYGNMQLLLNPSSAVSASNVQVGYESIALINQVVAAGSIGGT